MLDAVREVRAAQWSPDDPRLVELDQRIALRCGEAGDLGRARALAERVLATLERTLPADDLGVLRAKQDLGATLQLTRELERAHTLFEEVHDALVERLGHDDPDLVAARVNLGITTFELGDTARGLALLEDAYSSGRRVFTVGDPQTFELRTNLAAMRVGVGDVAGGIALLEAAIEDLPPGTSDEDPRLLVALQNLAAAYMFDGRMEAALELGRRLHVARRDALPPDHPDVLATKVNLAQALRAVGRWEEAAVLFDEARATCESTLPPDHPVRLGAQENLALSLCDRDQLDRAAELQASVIAGRERTLPPDHADVGRAYRNFGRILELLGDTTRLRDAASRLLETVRSSGIGASQRSPRGARATVEKVLFDLELVARWNEAVRATDGEPLDSALFETLETLRVVSTSAVELERGAATDDELRSARDELAQVRRELSDTSGVAPTDAAAVDAWRARLVELALRRGSPAAGLRMARLGLGAPPVELEVLASLPRRGARRGDLLASRDSSPAERDLVGGGGRRTRGFRPRAGRHAPLRRPGGIARIERLWSTRGAPHSGVRSNAGSTWRTPRTARRSGRRCAACSRRRPVPRGSR
ncbi:MAG: tetratricopeptide repeat protein [Planctomycetota bacterium]